MRILVAGGAGYIVLFNAVVDNCTVGQGSPVLARSSRAHGSSASMEMPDVWTLNSNVKNFSPLRHI